MIAQRATVGTCLRGQAFAHSAGEKNSKFHGEPALQAAITDPIALLLLSAERLMDGWSWAPISNGSRSDALDRRIYREVFPDSAWFKP
jgi:hypothetical protein